MVEWTDCCNNIVNKIIRFSLVTGFVFISKGKEVGREDANTFMVLREECDVESGPKCKNFSAYDCVGGFKKAMQ